MDRRIQKTKKAIFDAFISLLTEKSFEQITINEIADRADVNRSTVYFHFVDKYDLLEQCIDTHIAHLVVSCSSDTPEALMFQTFLYLEQNSQVFTTLLNEKGIPAFRNKLIEMVLQRLENQDNHTSEDSGIPHEIRSQFLASAVVGVLEWWVMQSMPYKAREMVDYFNLLMKQFPLQH